LSEQSRAQSTLFSRIESEISAYISDRVEVSPGVFFSQYSLINRIYKFRNRDISGSKINPDLSYNYHFDIISPRADSEIKNLRFDTKHVLVFSQNPRRDFAAVFLSNATLKSWMAEKGEDMKLKAAIEEFVTNGNIIFKKVDGGYETTDPHNTYITNQKAESVDNTSIIERHEMIASKLKTMAVWDQDMIDKVIAELGNKSFQVTTQSTPTTSTQKHYEIYEYTGEISEKEFNMVKDLDGGDENTYFLAKVVVAGLKKGGKGAKYVLFAEKLTGRMSDYYISAHRGRYEGRFWRVGMYEILFDHQIRANEIGNQLARGLDWASKVIFRSKDSRILQNIRADMDNGDIVITEDLSQVNVRMQGLDQLIADWNRLMNDADRLTNSLEVVRGENLPSGTPFRMGLLLDENAGKLFILLRQKITLPYQRVFREWILPELLSDLKGKDVFRFVGETDILEQLREIMVESWYAMNLVAIGPHTKEIGDAIKQEKMEEFQKLDPVIKNSKEIWKSVLPRLFVTITGENSDIQDQMQDMMTFVNLETDPERREWLLNTMYKVRNIPIPPKKVVPPPDRALQMNASQQPASSQQQPPPEQSQPVPVPQ
jgi:hypothetical protein